MLGSRILYNAHSALKVISEACILHCQQYDHLGTDPISAYATLTVWISLHNIMPDGSRKSIQATILESTFDLLLHCACNFLRSTNKSGNFASSGCSRDNGELANDTYPTKQRGISSMVKMLTAVLKFLVDAIAMNLDSQHQEVCLSFTMENLKFITTTLRQCSMAQLQFSEKDLKDIFICLKCLVTHGAKLLNIVLTTCEVPVPKQGAYSLVNELFNLFISVEEFLGYGYAAQLIQVVQPWVPDLILALGSNYLVKQAPDEGAGSDSSVNTTFHFPTWFYILARIELHELSDANSEEETMRAQLAKDFSAFKRLVETISKSLKSNNEILDAVGAILLTGSVNALRNKNFDVVLGLLRLVCVKLVSPDSMEWKEHKLMLASVEGIYSELETQAGDLHNNENDKQKLQCAMALLEPVWTSLHLS